MKSEELLGKLSEERLTKGGVRRGKFKVSEDSATIEMIRDRALSQEQALLDAGLDPHDWEIYQWECTEWDVTMGHKSTRAGVQRHTNYRIACKARRKKKPAIAAVLEDIGPVLAKVRKAPVRKGRPRLPSKNKHLLEIGLYDHHIGMLAWEREGGENWDVEIARNAFVGACDQMLAKTAGYPVEKILLPMGNDFFHVNDDSKSTPRNGNSLDVDGRICKLYRAGVESLLSAIQMCADVAKVEVLWVPGNHDPDTSFYALMLLHHAFAGDKRVTVDIDSPESLMPRKYIRYGNTLLGYTHGCDEKVSQLPLIMATERPEDFGKVRCREFHVGHRHSPREDRVVAGSVQGNVSIRTVPSLVPPDGWHYRKGYVRGERWAEAYLYGEEEGYTGTFTAWAK